MIVIVCEYNRQLYDDQYSQQYMAIKFISFSRYYCCSFSFWIRDTCTSTCLKSLVAVVTSFHPVSNMLITSYSSRATSVVFSVMTFIRFLWLQHQKRDKGCEKHDQFVNTHTLFDVVFAALDNLEIDFLFSFIWAQYVPQEMSEIQNNFSCYFIIIFIEIQWQWMQH